MSKEKNHFNVGNQYAAKPADKKKLSHIHIRCERNLKSRFVSNLYLDENLSSFILNACIAECKKREKQTNK